MPDNTIADAASTADQATSIANASGPAVAEASADPNAVGGENDKSLLHPDATKDPPPAPAQDLAPPATSPARSEEPDLTDYSKYKVGDVVAAGLKIEKIFFQTEEFIIFANDEGGVYFGGKNVPDTLRDAIAEFYRLTLDAEALKGAHRSDINRLFGYALARAALLPKAADVSGAFAHITKFIEEHSPVRRVFIRNDDCTVYVDRSNILTFDYPNLPAQLAPAVVEFRRLSQISTASLNEVDRQTAEGLLGTQLAVAFQTQSGDVTAFAAARDFIQKRLEAATRVDYVLASAVAAILLSIIAGIAYGGFAVAASFPKAGSLFLGALGGIVGAFISVLQRSASLEVQQFVPRKQVMIQAVVRLGLGSLFGVLLICAAFAGVVTVASTSFALFLIAVVAGFSERLMPDLLARLSTTVDAPPTTPSGTTTPASTPAAGAAPAAGSTTSTPAGGSTPAAGTPPSTTTASAAVK